MKLVHICLACTYTEGMDYQENYLAKYHAKEYDTYLITNQFMFEKGKVVKSKDRDYVNSDGVHVYRLEDLFENLPHKLNFYISIYKNFEQTLEKIGPDIIFIHNIQFNDIRVISKYAKRHPSVSIFADNHADFSNSGTNFVSRLLLKTEWRRCAHIIEPYTKKFFGVTPGRVDFLKNIYLLPKEKCELLVMGADDEKVSEALDGGWRKRIRSQYNILPNDFLIMTGGKIDMAKTQTLLLMEAVKNIGNPNVRLLVFGSVAPELKEKFDSLIDGDMIQYAGWVNAIDSYHYWAACDLAVFPGRHSVFWEQVAGMGIPLICKYWDGTTHVDIGGNAIFIMNDTVKDIQDAILDVLLNDKEKYTDMKRKAESSGKTIFSYQKISERAIDC